MPGKAGLVWIMDGVWEWDSRTSVSPGSQSRGSKRELEGAEGVLSMRWVARLGGGRGRARGGGEGAIIEATTKEEPGATGGGCTGGSCRRTSWWRGTTGGGASSGGSWDKRGGSGICVKFGLRCAEHRVLNRSEPLGISFKGITRQRYY